MIDQVYRCDAPACDGWWTEQFEPRLTVVQTVGGREDRLHFCHWDCALLYGGRGEPVETIEVEKGQV